VLLSRELSVFGTGSEASADLRKMDRQVAFHFERTRFLQGTNGRVYQGMALGLVLLGLAVVSGEQSRDVAGLAAVALILLRSLSYGQNMLSSLQQLAEQAPFVDSLIDLIEHYKSRSRYVGSTEVATVKNISFKDV